MSAWISGDLAELGVDISVFLHELASQSEKYTERTKKDFADEVHRKRVKFGLSDAIKRDEKENNTPLTTVSHTIQILHKKKQK